jgi:hypothetical protein
LKLTEEPQAPSANIREDLKRMPETTAQLRRRIVGDLDQIVLLCLRHDPRRRYSSAGALAEDLQRFLEGKSVLARRESAIEHALRFLKRNRVSVAVCAVVLAALGIGTWQAVAARMHERELRAREAAVKQVLEMLERKTPLAHLAPSNPIRMARVEDVRQLRATLEKELIPAWTSGTGSTPGRVALLMRAARYLNEVLPGVTEPVMAAEVAGAYQDLGTLFEVFYPKFALSAYNNAALSLQQGAGGDPGQGPNRRQWELIVARITGLGGVVPVLVPKVPQGRIPDSAQENSRSSNPVGQAGNKTDLPRLQVVPVQPAIDPAEYEAVSRSLDTTTSKSRLADETFTGLKAELEKRGEFLHPDIVANHMRMQAALESARHQLEKGDFTAARKDIEIANEYARRLMLVVGR